MYLLRASPKSNAAYLAINAKH
ncbi:MAG: hypothetical protein Q9M40_05390 [Sulfurimonas sp.]|nr:hypothetical protein [Sulfurimonas sp.]